MLIPYKRARTDASAQEGSSGVIAGPYGVGKSWFLGSTLEVYDPEQVLLVCTLSREKDSYFYQKYDVPYVLLWEDYMPTLDSDPQADVLPRFLDLMRELRKDEQFKFILVDSGTELAEAAWHHSMIPHGVASPAMMEDKQSRWLPYETLDIDMDQAIKAATALTMPDIAKLPKHVWFTWHIQAPKDDQEVKGSLKQSADNRAQDLEYEGKVLPMVRGRFRRRLGQLVTSFVFADKIVKKDVISKSIDIQYVVQVKSDPERAVKIPGPMPDGDGLINGLFLPNNWKAFAPFLDTQIQLQKQMDAEQKAQTVAARPGPVKSKRNLSGK